MNTTNCPHCGNSIKLIPLSNKPNWKTNHHFATGAPPSASSYSRETPAADLANIEAGAKLPLAQAAITTFAATLLTAAGCLYFSWPWSRVPIVAAGTFALSWWLLLIQSRQLLSSRKTTSADNEPQSFSIQLEITDTVRKRMHFADFQAKPEHLRRFAQAAADGIPTPEGAGLSRRKFNTIRDEALRRRLLRWRSEYHTEGLIVTSMGKRAFQRLADGALD
jgi:hypothetical protein